MPALAADISISGARVARELDQIITHRGAQAFFEGDAFPDQQVPNRVVTHQNAGGRELGRQAPQGKIGHFANPGQQSVAFAFKSIGTPPAHPFG